MLCHMQTGSLLYGFAGKNQTDVIIDFHTNLITLLRNNPPCSVVAMLTQPPRIFLYKSMQYDIIIDVGLEYQPWACLFFV